jgi:hypothetical protein
MDTCLCGASTTIVAGGLHTAVVILVHDHASPVLCPIAACLSASKFLQRHAVLLPSNAVLWCAALHGSSRRVAKRLQQHDSLLLGGWHTAQRRSNHQRTPATAQRPQKGELLASCFAAA